MPIKPLDAYTLSAKNLEEQAKPWIEKIDKFLQENARSHNNGASIDTMIFSKIDDMPLDLAKHIEKAYTAAGWDCRVRSDNRDGMWLEFSYMSPQMVTSYYEK
jgi:hypothetical protein